MKHYLPFFFWVGLSFLSFSSSAQISIDFPTDRAVFQRDKGNRATIHISGTYTKVISRIEARLDGINGQGEPAGDWKIIDGNPQGGFYSGSLDNVRGGWYKLEVRAFNGDQEVGFYRVDHVGVGEVFMIAGQSNGEGFSGQGSQGAQDDRVSSIDHYYTGSSVQDLPRNPRFVHLDSETDISPRGPSAWCWGRLGDQLVSRLGVPVLFFNVAWTGSAVRAWKESINGIGKSVYAPINFEPHGMPYGNMRNVIQRYTPITGLRGILWLQGEADNFKDTDTDWYFNDLKTVIEASRNDAGQDVSWVVSLTSYDNLHGTDSRVTDGQQRVINNVSNVFQGPNTDLIQIPRIDAEGVHFKDDGLRQLAEAWAQQLNDNFFSNSNPYQGVRPLKVTASCAGNGNLNLTADNVGYSQFNWSNGSNSNTTQVGNGTYQVSARDGKGHYIFSPDIRINENIQPNKPTIQLEGSNPVCLGNTATLISSTSENVRWSNGSTSDRIGITTGGEYSVTTRNVYGCESTSDKIAMTVSTAPLPPKPKIAASGVLEFCDGGEVSLTSDSKLKNAWSNGGNTATIVVKSSGEYRVRALDDVGCYSPDSDPVNVKVNALPQKPVVALSGNTTFCEGESITMTSNYDSGNIWSTAATTKAITIAATGTFSLKQRDANGCESTSDEIAVKVNTLPATPAITALRPTTFCLRDYTTLRSSEAFSYVWSNGETGREIEVRNSGDFTIAAKDQNGCVSPVSPVVKVVANVLPETPTIRANGPVVFCADLSVTLQSTPATGFLWSNGASTQSLRVTTQGTFSVQTINQFQCYSDPSNQITTQTLALPPSPTIEALGDTTFCAGDFVVLKATLGNTFFWNTLEEGESIQADTSGSYAARVRDDQGCFSPFSRAIKVDVKPTPTKPTIRQVGVFTLLAENNLNDGDHVWKLNGQELTENTATLKAIRSGSYVVNNTVVYSPTLTCFSDFSDPYSFTADTKNPGFVTYPNPVADGKITVETLQNLNNAEVQIIDSRGRIHRTFQVQKFDSQQFFNIQGLPSGVYIVRVVSVAFTASQKLIIVQ
ncbi:T9SS type A sorting domain-containing protein [Dyadobacter psychrophilus]|uniref:Por secretion system C-terminal sorting domain-containing protein n=1 Tax=Dyadobacter psychrophilus TaxID=651661 RepID=A0A1T5H4I6_9BACT|nr:sialate O-acetylesterase [Dyadobacter psychrophilus]SKC15509.1 Por secretion system C-terminal sorting domain-containing protein [Dyadobacter psychrophilus]